MNLQHDVPAWELLPEELLHRQPLPTKYMPSDALADVFHSSSAVDPLAPPVGEVRPALFISL
jgi:hypothetical protein